MPPNFAFGVPGWEDRGEQSESAHWDAPEKTWFASRGGKIVKNL